MQNDVREILELILNNQNEMKQDMSGMKQDVSGMKQDMSGMKQDITNLKLTLENDVRDDIRAIAEGHLILDRKLDVTLNTVNVINSKIEMHELHIKNNNDEIEKLKKIS